MITNRPIRPATRSSAARPRRCGKSSSSGWETVTSPASAATSRPGPPFSPAKSGHTQRGGRPVHVRPFLRRPTRRPRRRPAARRADERRSHLAIRSPVEAFTSVASTATIFATAGASFMPGRSIRRSTIPSGRRCRRRRRLSVADIQQRLGGGRSGICSAKPVSPQQLDRALSLGQRRR